jgi:hypothetical protein
LYLDIYLALMRPPELQNTDGDPLNFLFDPDGEIAITADELCAFLGAKKTTVSRKARLIQKAANIMIGNPDFSSP